MALSPMALALRFLKVRPRSSAELAGKLKDKGCDDAAIRLAIDELLKKRLLDDRAFADGWIRYRLARPFGFGRISRELKEKGVAQDIINAALEAARDGYEEMDTAFDLVKRKAARLDGLDPGKKKKRIFDFLLRRGFKVDTALKAIKKAGLG